MAIIDEIKKSHLAARKAAAKSGKAVDAISVQLLGLIVSDFSDKGNEKVDASDTKVISRIKEIMDGNRQIIDNIDPQSVRHLTLTTELDILSQFLPSQLTEEEMKEKMQEIIQEKGLSGMPDMKVLKEEMDSRYSGMFDKKLLGKFGKELLG